MPSYPPNTAHFDGNQVASTMGVVGTLGTADTGGTAKVLPVGVDPTTGALYVNNIGAGGSLVGGTDVNVVTGTQQTLGTVGTVLGIGGTVSVSGASAGTNVNVVTGTVNRVHDLGTVGSVAAVGVIHNAGTVQALPDIPGGTLDLGTVVGANASGGTSTTNPVQVGGTTSTGTVYGMLVDTDGNPQVDVVSSPQISVGTIPQISVGTLPTLNLTTGTITTGSLTNLATLHNGTVVVSTISADLPGGTVDLVTRTGNLGTLESGTISVLPDLPGGTLDSGTVVVSSISADLPGGTIDNITSGTVNVNKTPVVVGTSYGTLGTTDVAVWGTLIAASGAGTKQYISGLSVVVQSGTVDCAVTSVGTVATIGGAGILARGNFVQSAGVKREFDPVMVSGTNGTIAYYMGGAGTVWFDVQYWQQ